MSMQVFSFGGGVQSTAALVLAAQGNLDGITTFLFANVGDDSENPDTLRYVREIATPYAKAHGLEIIEVQKRRRDGTPETLYQHAMRPGTQIIMPVYLGGSGKPARRSCTRTFKLNVLAKWCREHGAAKRHPITTAVGISLDEWQRMRNDSGFSYLRVSYPLIERRLSRADCHNIITAAGLPTPPKSSCWFCPFHRQAQWREWRDLHDRHTDLWQQAAHVEQVLQQKARRYHDVVWLTKTQQPIERLFAAGVAQSSLFDDAEETFSCGPFVCAIDDGDGLGGAA